MIDVEILKNKTFQKLWRELEMFYGSWGEFTCHFDEEFKKIRANNNHEYYITRLFDKYRNENCCVYHFTKRID